jgi:hypothetical protein
MKSRKTKTVKTPRISRDARFVRPVLLLLLLFLVPAPGLRPKANAVPASKKLKPTDPYALIFGTVWGPDSRPVYGIKVTIRQLPKKKAEWELYSDHAGEFAQRVAAGKADYVVGADLKGVKMADGHPLHLAQEVNVHIDYDERVDIGLHLAP